MNIWTKALLATLMTTIPILICITLVFDPVLVARSLGIVLITLALIGMWTISYSMFDSD